MSDPGDKIVAAILASALIQSSNIKTADNAVAKYNECLKHLAGKTGRDTSSDEREEAQAESLNDQGSEN